ncbi:DUF5719 family protein [Streptomyces sp. SM12]|uniref:DUF5719 family protein n=1 Tax=Streptomyces sp. SM12 TaxID=1071602 RepID=UPI000CD56945|nr:DUF5719 family protein [Streptomyces sp. SM12]
MKLDLPGGSGLTRSPLVTLIAVGVALAAVAGMATLGGDADASGPSGEATRAPVERTTLVCPQPTGLSRATTWYTGFTPAGDASTGDTSTGDGEPGSAGLLPLTEYVPGGGTGADEDEDEEETEDTESAEDDGAEDEDEDGDDADAEPDDDRILLQQEPGTPVSDSTKDADAPALAGSADHGTAPGWTVQQTTLIRAAAGSGRGLMGTSCQRPDTSFWFAGASTAESRSDYVHLTNPDDSATVVDLDLYGPEGRMTLAVDEGVTVPGGSTVRVRLSTLTDANETDVGVHVTARTGRVGAQIEAVDSELGADWIAPVSAPEGAVVMPGIPADAETVRLVAFAAGEGDVNVGVGFAGPTATITPAGNESLYLRSGMVESVDLETVTQGEAGSLVLTPNEGSGPIVAALLVTRGEDDEQELAFIPATAPVEARTTASGNVPEGAELVLTAMEDDVEVEVTASPGDEGGSAVSDTLTVAAGTTATYAPELPDDTEGRYALTVRRTGGEGLLYAARVLTEERDDIPMFTVQTLPDDQSTVSVPETGPNLGVLGRR